MTEAVIDTNIIIDYLRGHAGAGPILLRVQDGSLTGYISTITEAELFAGKDEQDPRKREIMEKLLSYFKIIDLNSNIARKAGAIRRKYGIFLYDAVIAATAESLDLRVFTKNIKDFERIKEIKAEEPY